MEDPSLEEEGMNHSFEERPSSIHEAHQHIGGGESVHIGEEVSRKFTILVVIANVTADGDQQNNQHEEDCKYLHEGGGNSVAEEDL